MSNQEYPAKLSKFKSFQSSSGMVHSCDNYYSLVQKVGGDNLEKNIGDTAYQTAFGGKGKKSKKTKKSSSKAKIVKKTKKSSSKAKIVKKTKKSKKSPLSKTKIVKKSKKSTKPKKSIVNKAMNGVKKIKNMIMSKVSSMKKKRSKKQKGGQESSGATPMDMRFFNPKASLFSSSADSGMGANSAYGSVNPNDIGVGMLAPYTTSTSSTANHSSGQQTGCKKSKKSVKKSKVKRTKKEKSMINKIIKKMSNIKKSILPGDKKKSKKQSGGRKGDVIKPMSPNPIINAQNLAVGIIDGAVGALNSIVKGYKESNEKIKNIKIIGTNQNLIQGGKKSCSPKKSKKTKKSSSKKRPKKHKGGDGSAFAATQCSRGNASAPDDYWGVNGETWFRQFNKTGQYIPNSRLAEAATPLLLSGEHNDSVMGYDDMGIGSPYGNA